MRDLGAQFVDRSEFFLPAGKPEELDFHIHTVKVAVEVEEVDFQNAPVVMRHSRTGAEVDDAVK